MSCTHNKPTANRAGPTTSGPVEDEFVAEIRRRFRRLRGLVRTTVGYENDALILTQPQGNPQTVIVANSEERERIRGKLITDGGIQTYVQSTDYEKKLVKTSVPQGHYSAFHNKFGSGLTANAEPRERFEFNTRPELVNKFIRWLKDAIREEILEPPAQGESLETHWTAALIRSAYLNGFNQATGLLFQQGASVDNPDNSDILSRPISTRALQTLYTRTFENLRNITRDMADVIREELTEGFVQGENPRKMADRLTGEIRDIQASRAETLARTETMNAHSEAMLDRYEQAGVDVVAHEWASADDDRVCPFCERLDGIELGIGEVRNAAVSWAIEPDWKGRVWRLQPPAHPNCRCTLLPIIGAAEPTRPLFERLREEFGDRADVLQ